MLYVTNNCNNIRIIIYDVDFNNYLLTIYLYILLFNNNNYWSDYK